MDEPPFGPTSQSYISQRLRLHYVDWGNAGAPPLILVHGGQDHCRNWDWVAAAICAATTTSSRPTCAAMATAPVRPAATIRMAPSSMTSPS